MALYKAALFLITGIVDHGTGTRDITMLGGLRDTLTISFICAAVAALSMFGIPPLLGYLAKEEMYAALSYGDLWAIVTLLVMVVGNALLGTVALAVAIVPSWEALRPTPKPPHEGGFALWIGLGDLRATRTCRAVCRRQLWRTHPRADGRIDCRPCRRQPSVLCHRPWVACRSGCRSRPGPWRCWPICGSMRSAHFSSRLRSASPGDGTRASIRRCSPLIRLGGIWTRAFHLGRLELYLVVVIASVGLVLLVPLWTLGGWPEWPRFAAMRFYEWGAVGLAIIGVAVLVAARTGSAPSSRSASRDLRWR